MRPDYDKTASQNCTRRAEAEASCLSLKKRTNEEWCLNCSDLEALKVLTVAVIELMKEENVPMARRMTHTAKNLAGLWQCKLRMASSALALHNAKVVLMALNAFALRAEFMLIQKLN